MKLYRNLIILFVAIAVLVGAFIGVSMIVPESEENKTEEPLVSEAISVFEVDSSAVTKVLVKTSDEEYSVTKSGDSLILSNGTGLNISKSKLQSLIYSCSSVSASKIMTEKAGDAYKFGFDSAESSVTVETEDGTSKTILIADATLDNKSGYIKLADSDTVYLKSMYGIDNLTPEYKEFVDKTLLSIDTGDLSLLKNVYISKQGNTAVKLEYINTATQAEEKYAWKMTTPVYADVNGQVLSEHVLTHLENLTAVDIAEAHVKDRNIYEFNNPYAVFSIEYDSKTTKLIFGKKYNDYRFVMIDGYDSVYTIKDSSASFLDVPYQNLMSQLIHVEYIDQVSKVEIAGPDTDIIMEINDDEYKINGKSIEKKSFSKAYQAVIGISLDSVDLNATSSGNYDAAIKYTKNDGSVVTVGFISVSERNYLAVVDGKGNSITAKKNFNEAVDFVVNTYKKAK